MTTPAREQKLIRNGLIEEAAKRHPGDYQAAIKEGMQQFRVMLRKGLSEAVAPNTSTNRLNGPVSPDDMDDVGGNSFEAFLTDMIMAVSRQAVADGKANPAYTKLAAQLAAAQAVSAGGVQRGSYVSPAAGSTPVGRTESAPRGTLTESDLGQAAPVKDLADMSLIELQHEHMGRLGLLRDEGALRSPFYAPTAA
jgi:hypothetical protein